MDSETDKLREVLRRIRNKTVAAIMADYKCTSSYVLELQDIETLATKALIDMVSEESQP